MTFKDTYNVFSSFFSKNPFFKRYFLLFLLFFLILNIFFFIELPKKIFKTSLSNNGNILDVNKSNKYSIIKEYFLDRYQSPYKKYKYTIKNNDSIEKILNSHNVKYDEIKLVVNDLKKNNLSNIYMGREMEIILKKNENKKSNIVNILYPVSNTLIVQIRRSANGFDIKKNIIKLNKKEVVVRNTITTNLYTAAIQAGIEPNIIIEFARIFGFEVDFQRDIRKGDWFEIFYERFEDDNDIVKDTGKIIYASMFVNGEEINLYNFNYKNEEEYYDIKGKSITKSLMKTPINGARLSSSFGMRKHPILGYNKMHRGTDFAAPSGTPIMASGSGTVTRARWCGGGGNCVKIKHNSTYETVYAHMKSFAKGVKEGKKVKQGQIIGYVGSTGMSTGPHLHYEVIVNGKKVNSQRLKLPSGKILKGAAREKFEFERIKIDLKLAQLR